MFFEHEKFTSDHTEIEKPVYRFLKIYKQTTLKFLQKTVVAKETYGKSWKALHRRKKNIKTKLFYSLVPFLHDLSLKARFSKSYLA